MSFVVFVSFVVFASFVVLRSRAFTRGKLNGPALHSRKGGTERLSR
jgi:hypothetical protein